MREPLNIAVLEPYYGGSHAVFADALAANSRHRMILVTMPARKWKWRMRGAAVWFAQNVQVWANYGDVGTIDAILCTDMLSVADLRALLPGELRNLPIICYFHENQLTYPLPDDQERDFQYGMTNITSCLAADAVWFNSRFHLEDFLAAARSLLGRMPDYVPKNIIGTIRQKAEVIPPPVLADRVERRDEHTERPLTILWSHRWEYDKNPQPFFEALLQLAKAGTEFSLVLTGKQFRTAPPLFARVRERLDDHIVHAGYILDRRAYLAMLSKCDIVVSTAIQENFGLSVLEAILAGCQPLLPNRLVYPEIIPCGLHAACLYPTDADLFDRLKALLSGADVLSRSELDELQRFVEDRFGGQNAVSRLDKALARVVRETPTDE